MKCDEVSKQLPLLEYGELSFDAEESLHQHLDGCAACRQELDRVRALQRALDAHDAEVDAALLLHCRRKLRLNVGAFEEAGFRRSRFSAWLHELFSGIRIGAPAKPVGAVALVALGFFGARFMPADSGQFTRSSLEPVASRVRYVEPNAAGRVQIVVEETSQRTLSGLPGDENIRRLLIAASRDSADPGVRVESMNLLKDDCASVDVRRALINALQHDANPSVRLKALEGLRPTAADSETRSALAHTLLTDDNPSIRTQAIDLLVQRREPAMVGVLQELMRKEDNDYVRLRCRKVLHEMKASVDTF